MFGSPQAPPSKDLNLPYPAAGPFGSQHAEESETDALRRRQQQQQMSYGLLRYQSAPSSLLGEECGAENEAMFARLLAPDLHEEARTKTSGDEGPQFPPPPPEEVNVHQSMIFHRRHQQTPNHSSIGSSFTVDVGSFPMETGQIKKGSYNLIRQSSSPAGLFSYFAVDNGYGMPSGIAGFRDKRQLSFSSRQSSVMSQISEMDSEDVEGNSDKEKGGGAVDDDRNFMPERFPVNSLDDSFVFNNTFFSLKGGREGEVKTPGGLSSVERRQDGEVRNHASGLPHQLNLPNNSSAMAAMENFLHLHDAVPCKIRAKRGCATHPRSIAERVRRTRISDRMRRLQDLVPNMDKQTNTADMLDLAVDYMKDLQKQVKALSEIQANCNCSASRQKPF